jgi:hypothetical protein
MASIGVNSYVRRVVANFPKKISEYLGFYLRDLSNYSTLLEDFFKIMEYEKSGAKTKLMLILLKYGSKDRLKQEMDSIWEKLEGKQEMLNIIVEMENVWEKGITCPYCNGVGWAFKGVKYVEIDDVKEPQPIVEECQGCGGKGVVNIPEELKKELASYMEIAMNTLKLMQTYRQIVQKLEENLLKCSGWTISDH